MIGCLVAAEERLRLFLSDGQQMVDLSLGPRQDTKPLVLLVDDNAATRDVLAVFLADWGFCVEQARDPQEALVKIQSEVPAVVVADIGADGFALGREIKRDSLTAPVPVIALADGSALAQAEAAAEGGFDTLLLKPCLPTDVLREIRQTTNRTRALRAEAADLRDKATKLMRDTQSAFEQLADTMKRP